MYIWEIKHSPLGAEVRTHSALGSHALSPILYPPYVPIGHDLCNTYIAHACSAKCWENKCAPEIMICNVKNNYQILQGIHCKSRILVLTKTLLCELHICIPVHTSLPLTAQS